MRVPVLTYHSMRIDGASYAENDTVALASDLATIDDAGFRILPLRWVVEMHRRGELAGEGKVVALSCDDGSDFDFFDLPHPVAGPQRSVLNVLRDFAASRPGSTPHITSFVVVSPEARRELDVSCMIGKDWWTDGWWRAAKGSGFMHIANHSWDHNHDALSASFDHGVERGTFRSITTEGLADLEIRDAVHHLRSAVPNPGTALFAYPYGEGSEFLRAHYFPSRGESFGLRGAFADHGGYLVQESDPWNLPRFVFGRDWSSPGALREILAGA